MGMATGVGGSEAAAELAAIRNRREEVPPIGVEEHDRRVARAQARMRELGIGALWLDATTNLAWMTGLRHGQSERPLGAVLPADGALRYLSPAFEADRIRSMLVLPGEVAGWEEDEDPYALVAGLLRAAGVPAGATLAVDDMARMFVAEGLRAALPGMRLVASGPVTSELRSRKTEHEVALLRHAMGLTLQVQAAAARILRPGIATTEVAAFLDAAHRAAGFDAGAAFSIVLFGAPTASPHGVPWVQHLAEGDTVLVDTGGALHGYVSDITRSYVFGTPSPEQRRVWEVAQRAQAAGFAAARPGAPCAAVDAACRAVVEAAGFGPGYRLPGLPHRTGHGIGMDVHEAPYFVGGNATPMAPGHAGSIEPTIAIPGAFGIRLEDHVVLTEAGADWLTPPARSIDDPFGRA